MFGEEGAHGDSSFDHCYRESPESLDPKNKPGTRFRV